MLEIILIILLAVASLAVLALAVTNRQLQKDQRYILDESLASRKAFEELRANDVVILKKKLDENARIVADVVKERDAAYASLELTLKDNKETKK